MNTRFHKDCIISLATCENNIPTVREVDAFYENGCFYCITCADSRKVRQIQQNPNVAVAGEWLTGHGQARILGDYQDRKNQALTRKLEAVFDWFDPERSHWPSPYTLLIEIMLEDGQLQNEGTLMEADFNQ